MPLVDTIGSVAWLIPALTLAAFFAGVAVVALGAPGRLAARISVLAMAASTLLGLALFVAAWRAGGELLATDPRVWSLPWAPMGSDALRFGWMVDPLSTLAVAMVTIVCLMIFIYSTSYMEGEHTAYRDPQTGDVDASLGEARYGRFFAFVALFATGMLGFVLSSNLLEGLVFWEIMGLCSFLLIGFWYHKPAAAAAAVKAFLTTRVGDVFLLVGILLLYAYLGSVDYATLLRADSLGYLAQLGNVPGTGLPIAAAIALCVFGGAVGKSAQVPLHVWLPDAMEGPTPVSALIHAATMVSAGVFLVARLYPLFSALSLGAPDEISGAMFAVAFVGALTAIFAATIGLAQFDIKRVLAFSTISQLGYMVMALGIGAYVAAVFHLITHAFFKALLFLASGSVIHGVEHGHRHAQDHPSSIEDGDGPEEPPKGEWLAHGKDPQQDMRNMGALRARMPLTFAAFLAGALALTGIPVFSGFWSKDEILAEAFHKAVAGDIGIAMFVWALGTVGAFLTALYMARQVFLVFGGRPRTGAARHALESDPAMVYPLLALAGFATVLGFAGVSESFPVLGPALDNPLHRFVGALTATGAHMPALPFDAVPALISVGMAATGWLAGWWLYGRPEVSDRRDEPLERLGGIYRLLANKYYVDELYAATVLPATRWLSSFSAAVDARAVDGLVNRTGVIGRVLAAASGWFDTKGVDGVVNQIARLNVAASRALRTLQTGHVQQYMMIVVLGFLLLIGFFAF